MTLEKEILKEFKEKCTRENHDIMPINKDHQEQLFKVLIQLTQSKIISIIDKRIEELKKEKAVHINTENLTYREDKHTESLCDFCYRINRAIKELKSLLESEKGKSLDDSVITKGVGVLKGVNSPTSKGLSSKDTRLPSENNERSKVQEILRDDKTEHCD